MSTRTDLAIDIAPENAKESEIRKTEFSNNGVTVTDIELLTDECAEKYGKKKGRYITVEFSDAENLSDTEKIETEITNALKILLPEINGTVLVAGLGNSDITSDSIGPFCADKILASRHISGEFAESIGLKGLKSVSVIAPGVLGKTGVETAELIKAVTDKIKPCAVIVIDALASSSIFRLFSTVQLCNTGISPGSGVKNSRKELSPDTLGVPVIAVGVPTVMEASKIAEELTESNRKTDTDMIITPKDCDLLCRKLSDTVARAVNVFLQPEIEPELLLQLV